MNEFFPYIDEPGKVAGYRVEQLAGGYFWEWVENDETLFAEGPFDTFRDALEAAYDDADNVLLRNSLSSKLKAEIMRVWAVA